MPKELPAVEIRSYSKWDRTEVHDIDLMAFPSRRGRTGIPMLFRFDQVRELFEYLNHKDHPRLFVATCCGYLVGYCCTARNALGVAVSRIAIRPAWQRRGIGRKLFDHAVNEYFLECLDSSEERSRDIYMVVGNGAEAANRFAQSLGFLEATDAVNKKKKLVGDITLYYKPNQVEF